MPVATAEEAVTRTETAVLCDLLTARRERSGRNLDDIAAAADIPLERAEAVETGCHDLSDAELNRLLGCYGVAQRSGILRSLVVEVNLDGGWVAMKRSRRPGGRRPAADRNLINYLSLVYQDRALDDGTRIPLKSVDLSVLRPALAIRRSEVLVRLEQLNERLPSALREDRSLLAVATAAGLSVAAGAIILVPLTTAGGRTDTGAATGDAQPTTQIVESVGPTPEIGTAIRVERGIDDLVADVEEGPAPPGAVEAVEVGAALLVERAAEETARSAKAGSQRTSRGPPPEVHLTTAKENP